MAFPCFRTTLNLLLFLVLTPSVFAQTPPNVTLGSYLIASDTSVPWKSPSGEFSFGFHQINNQKLFLLGIWFDTIPEKTLVWYANGDDMSPEGSKVELTLDGSFRLIRLPVLKDEKYDELVKADEEVKNDMKTLERLVMVSIWCIQEDPSLRPSMRTVTQMLEGIVQVSVPPCPSPFSSIC